MITLSNGLSFARAPLALLFLQENTAIRIVAILLAMITDSIDGYIARRLRSTSQFGAILDPAMDKFFVYFVLTVLFLEGNIKLWEASTMLARDFGLFVFGLFLIITKNFKSFRYRSVRWGKVTTSMQFCVLIGLTLHMTFSWVIYVSFIIFGIMAFIEFLRLSPSYNKQKLSNEKET
jgi:CDP-diacylglycerol---glycerol-3-phosphate 3-phosphatidyltransferase